MKSITQFILLVWAIVITLLLTLAIIRENNIVRSYKIHIAALHTANDAYERYYCATEEMLDRLPYPTQDSLTTTEQGFRYIEEKAKVDSICHNVLP